MKENYCQHCGANLPMEAIFCSACGKKQQIGKTSQKQDQNDESSYRPWVPPSTLAPLSPPPPPDYPPQLFMTDLDKKWGNWYGLIGIILGAVGLLALIGLLVAGIPLGITAIVLGSVAISKRSIGPGLGALILGIAAILGGMLIPMFWDSFTGFW